MTEGPAGDDGGALVDVPESYPVIETVSTFRSGRVIDVRTDLVAMADGGTVQRDVVVHPGAVGVVAYNEADEVLLVRQYRHPVRQLLWEPPAGLLDQAGESPLDAAKRELYEEAHLTAKRWDVLVDAFTSPGMCDEAVRIYLARDVEEATQERHVGAHEEFDMPTRWVPVDEAVDAILAGRLHNPLAAMGLLALVRARENGFAGLRTGDAPWPQMSPFSGSASAAQT